MRTPSDHVALTPPYRILPFGGPLEPEYPLATTPSMAPLSEEREQSPYRLLPGVVSLERWLDLNA